MVSLNARFIVRQTDRFGFGRFVRARRRRYRSFRFVRIGVGSKADAGFSVFSGASAIFSSATVGGFGAGATGAGVALDLLAIERIFSGSAFGFVAVSGAAAAKCFSGSGFGFCAAAIFSAAALRFSIIASSGRFILDGARPRAQPVTRPPSTK